MHLKDVPGTRSVYAERVTTGYFLDIDVKREEAARYGLTVEDVQDVIQSAIGGMNLTTTVEGRERYPGQRPVCPGAAGRHREAEEGPGAGHGGCRPMRASIPMGAVETRSIARSRWESWPISRSSRGPR